MFHKNDHIQKEDFEVEQIKTTKRKHENDNLPTRKKSNISKKIEISCEECDYKTDGKRSLNSHTKKVHKNVN